MKRIVTKITVLRNEMKICHFFQTLWRGWNRRSIVILGHKFFFGVM